MESDSFMSISQDAIEHKRSRDYEGALRERQARKIDLLKGRKELANLGYTQEEIDEHLPME